MQITPVLPRPEAQPRQVMSVTNGREPLRHPRRMGNEIMARRRRTAAQQKKVLVSKYYELEDGSHVACHLPARLGSGVAVGLRKDRLPCIPVCPLPPE